MARLTRAVLILPLSAINTATLTPPLPDNGGFFVYCITHIQPSKTANEANAVGIP